MKGSELHSMTALARRMDWENENIVQWDGGGGGGKDDHTIRQKPGNQIV